MVLQAHSKISKDYQHSLTSQYSIKPSNLLTTETTPYHTDICLLNNQEATQKNPAHACTWQYKLITPNKHTLKNHPAYTCPTSMKHQKNPVHAGTGQIHTLIYTKRVLPLPRPCSGIGGRGEPLKEAATYSPALRCSTIGAGGLNFSVRDGKRWNPAAIAAWYSLFRTWSPL